MSFYDRSKCCGAPVVKCQDDLAGVICGDFICTKCDEECETATEDRFAAETPDDQPRYVRSDY